MTKLLDPTLGDDDILKGVYTSLPSIQLSGKKSRISFVHQSFSSGEFPTKQGMIQTYKIILISVHLSFIFSTKPCNHISQEE